MKTRKQGIRMLLVLLSLTLLSLPVTAKIKFGLRGGVNMVDMNWSLSEIVSEDKTGFYIGPAVKIGTPLLDIDLAALYDQCDIEVEGRKIKDKNMNLQFSLRKGFGLGDKFGVFVFAGPQFGFNLGDKCNTLEDGIDSAKEWRWKDSQLTINVGFGVMLLNHLELRAGYNIATKKTAHVSSLDETGQTLRSLDAARKNTCQVGATVYF